MSLTRRHGAALCTPAPSRWPNASNTGVTGTLTTWTGGYNLTTANQIITGYQFNLDQTLNVKAAGVEFHNCRFVATKPVEGSRGLNYLVDLQAQGAGKATKFIDCEFDGNGTWADSPSGVSGVYAGWAPTSVTNAYNNGFYLLRCHLHDLSDGVDFVGTNMTLDSCYLHDGTKFFDSTGLVGGESHVDGGQLFGDGCSNITVVNNSLSPNNAAHPTYVGNSAFQFGHFNPGSTVANVLLDGNLFDGGGFTLSGYSTATLANTAVCGFVISNNRFGLNNLYGPSYPDRAPQIGWSNNAYDVSGTTGHGDVVTAGQLIP